jgi:hypothetical protein
MTKQEMEEIKRLGLPVGVVDDFGATGRVCDLPSNSDEHLLVLWDGSSRDKQSRVHYSIITRTS